MNDDNNFLPQAHNTPETPHSVSTSLTLSPARFTAILLIVIIVIGMSGYFLGIRNSTSIPRTGPSPSSHTQTIIHTAPTISPIFEIVNPERNARKPRLTKSQGPSPHWLLYKSAFGYQYYYPPDWQLHPEVRVPESSVSSPGVHDSNGRFTVQRLFPTTCEFDRAIRLKQNPDMRQTKIILSGYSADQIQGKYWDNDGFEYDGTFVYVTRDSTCYELRITSNIAPDALPILTQVLSTFKLYHIQDEYIKARKKLKSLGVTNEALDSLLYRP